MDDSWLSYEELTRLPFLGSYMYNGALRLVKRPTSLKKTCPRRVYGSYEKRKKGQDISLVRFLETMISWACNTCSTHGSCTSLLMDNHHCHHSCMSCSSAYSPFCYLFAPQKSWCLGNAQTCLWGVCGSNARWKWINTWHIIIQAPWHRDFLHAGPAWHMHYMWLMKLPTHSSRTHDGWSRVKLQEGMYMALMDTPECPLTRASSGWATWLEIT